MAYPSAAEERLIACVEALMDDTMSRYDPSHDAYHVRRVRSTALSLARTFHPTPDLLVVDLAALLHDILDKKYLPADQQHIDAYTFFLPHFQRWTDSIAKDGDDGEKLDLITDGRAKLITRIVENVSWTTEKRLRAQTPSGWTPWHDTCAELHCVQDADRLDAIGAFGILRVAAYSCKVGRPLHASAEDPKYEVHIPALIPAPSRSAHANSGYIDRALSRQTPPDHFSPQDARGQKAGGAQTSSRRSTVETIMS